MFKLHIEGSRGKKALRNQGRYSENCCERCLASILTTGRSSIAKIRRKARAETIPVQSDCCREMYHIVWLKCSGHLQYSRVQDCNWAATQHNPKGGKGLLTRPPRHFTSHPACTQSLQETELKLLVNWQHKQMFVAFIFLSGFSKVQDGETLYYCPGFTGTESQASQGLQAISSSESVYYS